MAQENLDQAVIRQIVKGLRHILDRYENEGKLSEIESVAFGMECEAFARKAIGQEGQSQGNLHPTVQRVVELAICDYKGRCSQRGGY